MERKIYFPLNSSIWGGGWKFGQHLVRALNRLKWFEPSETGYHDKFNLNCLHDLLAALSVDKLVTDSDLDAFFVPFSTDQTAVVCF